MQETRDLTRKRTADMRPRRRHRRVRQTVLLSLMLLSLYGLIAYMLLPILWTHYEHQKGLAGLPMVTRTAQGIPGDPINVGLIGSRDDIACAMQQAGWSPAAPISIRSSIGIAGSVIFRRPYRDAPVSNLYYLDRREDLAYEKQVGDSADQRHHVRLWRVLDRGAEDRPVWLGDAAFDRGVGVSRYTGAVTHHIAPDIDAERAALAADLEAAGMATAKYQVTGIGPTLAGRNGGGDPYYTDGEVWILRLVEHCRKNAGSTVNIASPLAIQLKDQIWQAIAAAVRK
jgi:hypothetical protein